MQVDINEPRRDYKVYTSNIENTPPRECMPLRHRQKLLQEGRRPLTGADLMQRRLETLYAPGKVGYFWWENPFIVGHIVHHEDGRIKLVRDADNSPLLMEILRKIDSERPDRVKRERGTNIYWEDGGVFLPDGLYERFLGLEFTSEEREQMGFSLMKRPEMHQARLSKEEVISSKFWQFLAEDIRLLETYADILFDRIKSKYVIENDRGMGIFVRGQAHPHTIMWPVSILGLSENSDVEGSFKRGHPGSYLLVGVAPETPLEAKIESSLDGRSQNV